MKQSEEQNNGRPNQRGEGNLITHINARSVAFPLRVKGIFTVTLRSLQAEKPRNSIPNERGSTEQGQLTVKWESHGMASTTSDHGGPRTVVRKRSRLTLTGACNSRSE